MVGQREGRYLHVRSRCKSYSCPHCGPKKGRQVRRRIAEYATEHGLQRMVTLTLDPRKLRKGLTQKQRVEYIRDCWRKMRVYLKRKCGRSITFIAVLEFQKNGNPHLHILVGSFLPSQWLSESWQSLGGGFTDIRFVDVHRVAAYLAKYMTKAWLEGFPVGCRRITASCGLVFFARSGETSGWVLVYASIDWLRQIAERRSIPLLGVNYEDGISGGVLIAFETPEPIDWSPPHFRRCNRWSEAKLLERTGRIVEPACIKYSHATGRLEERPARIEYLR